MSDLAKILLNAGLAGTLPFTAGQEHWTIEKTTYEFLDEKQVAMTVENDVSLDYYNDAPVTIIKDKSGDTQAMLIDQQDFLESNYSLILGQKPPTLHLTDEGLVLMEFMKKKVIPLEEKTDMYVYAPQLRAGEHTQKCRIDLSEHMGKRQTCNLQIVRGKVDVALGKNTAMASVNFHSAPPASGKSPSCCTLYMPSEVAQDVKPEKFNPVFAGNILDIELPRGNSLRFMPDTNERENFGVRAHVSAYVDKQAASKQVELYHCEKMLNGEWDAGQILKTAGEETRRDAEKKAAAQRGNAR